MWETHPCVLFKKLNLFRPLLVGPWFALPPPDASVRDDPETPGVVIIFESLHTTLQEEE